MAISKDKAAQSQKSPKKFRKWLLFDDTIRQVRESFHDVSAGELHALIERAVASVGKERHRERKGRQTAF